MFRLMVWKCLKHDNMTTHATWDSVNKPNSAIESARKGQTGQRKSRTLGKPVSFYTRNICTIVFCRVSSTWPANLICICFLDEKKGTLNSCPLPFFAVIFLISSSKTDWDDHKQTLMHLIYAGTPFKIPPTRSETQFGSFTNPAIPSYWKHALISNKICSAKGQVSHDTLGRESTRPAWPAGSCGWGGSCNHFHPFSSCRAEWCICKMPLHLMTFLSRL